MTERPDDRLLLAAIREARDSDAPRLVLADRLIERADRWGDLIVTQCEIARRERAGEPGVTLTRNEWSDEYLRDYHLARALNGCAPSELDELRRYAVGLEREVFPAIDPPWVTYDRGFVVEATASGERFDRLLESLSHPVFSMIEELSLSSLKGDDLARLAATPALDTVARLSLETYDALATETTAAFLARLAQREPGALTRLAVSSIGFETIRALLALPAMRQAERLSIYDRGPCRELTLPTSLVALELNGVELELRDLAHLLVPEARLRELTIRYTWDSPLELVDWLGSPGGEACARRLSMFDVDRLDDDVIRALDRAPLFALEHLLLWGDFTILPDALLGRLHQLQHLDVITYHLDDGAALARLFGTLVAPLRELSLRVTQLDGDAVIRALCTNPRSAALEELQLECPIGTAGVTELASSRYLANLRKLDLTVRHSSLGASGSGLGPDEVAALARSRSLPRELEIWVDEEQAGDAAPALKRRFPNAMISARLRSDPESPS